MSRGTRRIVVCNQKGGVAKTTVTVNLAHALSERDKRVLVIDLDSQGNVGAALGLKHNLTVDDFFKSGALPFHEYIVSYKGRFDAILSNNLLGATEAEITGRTGRELILAQSIEELFPNDYDYILMDTSPSISVLNQNAYMAASEAILPCTLDPLSILGCEQTIENMALLKRIFKHQINIIGIVPTLVNLQSNVAKQLMHKIEKNYDGKVLPSIRQSVKAREASAMHVSIFDHDPVGKVAEDYRLLAESIEKAKV